MKKKNICHFVCKLGLLLLPLWLVITLYLIQDPFKVIRSYDTYYRDGKPTYVSVDHDYVSTQVLVNTYPLYRYNSYILGSSRSRFYPNSEWEKHIGTQNNSYHFDGSGETLYGVYRKLVYLDRHSSLRHVLLIVDHELLEMAKRKTTHLNYLAPQLDGHAFDFQLTFLKTFCSPDMLSAYTLFKLTGVVPEWAKKKYILDDRPMNYRLKGNEMEFREFEQAISRDTYYTPRRMQAFPPRDTTRQSYTAPLISSRHLELLNGIHAILKKHHTDYKVVVSPLYDQLKLHPADLATLRSIFGSGHVADFSGINAYTNNYRNYYESSHYRPTVAIDIMNRIYGHPASNLQANKK